VASITASGPEPSGTAVTIGTPGFAMAAFSAAICSSVSPRSFVCSSSIVVTAVADGVQTLVASRRPPRPTSSTTVRQPASRNATWAAAVRSSKNVG
jgi:hypothetical protein